MLVRVPQAWVEDCECIATNRNALELYALAEETGGLWRHAAAVMPSGCMMMVVLPTLNTCKGVRGWGCAC